jgi:phage host-nuclease inhibitor protein Gam
MMPKALYDTDFYAWTKAQAEALRTKDLGALDLENLAEEIDSLGKRDRRGVESYIEAVMKHLLKWVHQPQERSRRGRSWRLSVRNARSRMERLLEDNPSLRTMALERFVRTHQGARKAAAEETGLPLATFPEACPWTLAQLQDEEFSPDAEAR